MNRAGVRLNNEEAKALGFEIKNKPKKGNPKYFITTKQQAELSRIRGEHLIIKGKSTLKDADGNLVMEWTKTEVDKETRLKAAKEVVQALIEDIKPVKPREYKMPIVESELINQYTLTDFHLGMMAWGEETGADWDLKIAEEVLLNYFRYAITNSPFASTCIFAQLGDFLHWDGILAVTPQSKHVLDADTRFSKLIRVAIRVSRQVINMLLDKYQTVHVIMAEGNHDESSSIWLREMFAAFYENEPRVKIDTSPDPYYCIEWGETVLFYHHGHKRNLNNIDTVFTAKFKEQFGRSKNVYAHTGHLHNMQVKETNLMVIEQHRTLAAKDAYASRGGWLSGRDSKVITYHKRFGEVDRRTINIRALID